MAVLAPVARSAAENDAGNTIDVRRILVDKVEAYFRNETYAAESHAALNSEENEAELTEAIRDRDELLSAEGELRTTLALRDPYIDPLFLLQLRFLEEKRSLPAEDPRRVELDRLIGTTISGIAHGLRNTG